MSVRPPAAETPESATIEAATCLACGCLCDDIGLTVESGRVLDARSACPIGVAWFRGPIAGEVAGPPAAIEGTPVDPRVAVARAAELLANARSPLVLGLDRSTNQTVAAAIGLADRVGAYVEIGDGMASMPRILAMQRVGRVSATLGEVKSRADVVVFWRSDPATTHPRHLERYSAEPRGRFIPGGRADRRLIVVDTHRTATAAKADWYLELDEGRELETLWSLRALVRGVDLRDDRIGSTTGLDPSALRDLAGQLAAARYGAFFLGEGERASPPARATARSEAASLLVRDLNSRTRFVLLSLGSPGNVAGAEGVLARQAGFPSCVDLSAGYPRSLPGVATAAERIAAGSVDVALIVGSQGLGQGWTSKTSRIVIAGPGVTDGPTPAVRLTASRPGIEEGGSVTRVDGVSLPLRPIRRPAFPTERDWIERILAAITPSGRTS
ncbi:formylmethanofuran dehydrogenase subunit B [Aquisphaera insulae]|uniref:formylmethanofuran dehydrogenase subunit B n=1 Tax=Aquisphaera insulae TaxID=2712864 RepID=UPI0013EDBF96|nr:formylmethanofuran dehydrogenase subunit B [Aquisphaera insulae]